MNAATISANRHYGMYAIFLLGYLLMTFLIFDQNRTIESQKLLIRSLFYDSTELAAIKLKRATQAP